MFKSKNRTLISFWIIGVIAFGVRFFLNFSQELLLGNGGYYPLQVRTVLKRGELAFPDMPFLFHLEAFFVRFISFFGITPSNEVILNVVKTIDSISIPLLLIPLYQIFNSLQTKFSIRLISLISFAVLSFYTLNLTSSFQKNSMGILLLFFAIAQFLKFINTRQISSLMLALLFFALIGLTHFGTFAFSLLIITTYLIFKYKKKAVIPIIALIVSSLILISLFDPVRAERLYLVWQSFFSRLPPPPQLLLSIVYIFLAVFFYRFYRKNRETFADSYRAIVLTSITLLVIIPIPLIDPQASGRLSVFLFIPIILLTLLFAPHFSKKLNDIIAAILGLITLGSMSFFLTVNPPTDVNQMALEDLEKMKPFISNPDNSVVVSRHNLEFWVAWALETDVSQESKFNDTLINEYDDVYIINQIRDEDPKIKKIEGSEARERNHFDEPIIPSNSTLVYSSSFFKLYHFNKEEASH